MHCGFQCYTVATLLPLTIGHLVNFTLFSCIGEIKLDVRCQVFRYSCHWDIQIIIIFLQWASPNFEVRISGKNKLLQNGW